MTAPQVTLLVILYTGIAVFMGWYNSDMRKMAYTAEERRWHARLVLLAPLWPLVIVYALVRNFGRWIKEVWNDAW